MQPINLLPPYIYDKQKKFALIGVWGAAVAFVVIAIVVWAGNIGSDQAKADEEKALATQRANDWAKADSAVKASEGRIAETKSKLTFVSDSKNYNDAWPQVFEVMRDYTSPDILLRALSLDPVLHKTFRITGFAANESKIMQWWIQLRNSQQFSNVSFDPIVHDYSPPGAQSQSGFGRGFGGGGGSGGGPMMGGMSSMSGMMGPPGGGGSGGGPMMSGMMGPPGGGGFGSARRGSSGNGRTEIDGRTGIEFTASATLKQPTPLEKGVPSWPPGAAGGGGAGRGGGMGSGMSMGMGMAAPPTAGSTAPSAGGGLKLGGKRGGGMGADE